MHPPVLTREQARAVDRRAIEEYGMSSLVLMENAGRGCVDTLVRLGIAGPVVVCCGRGNNGGDGFVIARRLDLLGYDTRVILCGDAKRLSGDAAANYHILAKSDVPVVHLGESFSREPFQAALAGADWVIDALLGTGARGEPKPPLDEVLGAMNDCPARKLAVDLPSGMDCDTGHAASFAFRADHTCTFVAAKPGFLADAARQFIGQWHVVDIGAPRKLVAEMLAERA